MADLETTFVRWQGACGYCGSPVTIATGDRRVPAEHRATRDHFVPKSAGGTSREENIVLSCANCNTTKANIDPCKLVRLFVKLNPKQLAAIIENEAAHLKLDRINSARLTLSVSALQELPDTEPDVNPT